MSFQISTGNTIPVVVNETCFLLNPPRPYQQQCLLPSVRPLYGFMEIAENIFHVPFWMPIKKNGFSFQWMEPSRFYGQEFTEHVINKNDGNNCLVYYNSTFIQTANCTDLYSSICVFSTKKCFVKTDTQKRNINTATSLKLVKSVKNASRLFLAIEYEKHLKTLGQHPFKCFLDLNVSNARVLYNSNIFSIGRYKNISVYGFPILNSVTTNYWCEAFISYNLKMLSSNKVYLQPCDANNYINHFTFAIDSKLFNPELFFKNNQKNFCVQSVSIKNDNKIMLNVVTNKTANEVTTSSFQNRDSSNQTTEIFCFNFNDLLRNTTNSIKMTSICIKLPTTTLVTEQLIDVLNSSYTPSESMFKLLTISEKYKSFSAIDVYLTALIFRKFSNANVDATVATSIVRNIMEINRKTLKQSQYYYNATSMLLYRFDRILANAEMNNATDYLQIHQGSIMTLIANAKYTNLGGIAAYNYSGNTTVIALSKTITIELLLNNPNLHSAILLPEIITGIKTDTLDENAKVALTIFLKDSLFNGENSSNIKQVSSIFGAAFKSINDGLLDNPIYVLFKSTEQKNKNCAYWKLHKPTNDVMMNGHWVTTNIQTLDNYTDFVVCKYYKFAHFALLILEDVYQTMDSDLIEILESITIVNSAFSLFGAIGIILTAILFKSWRKNKGNLVLMNFVLAIGLHVISLHISNYVNNRDSEGVCSGVGAVLHYSVLSEFCWMLVIAVLQYKRYVQVFASQTEHLMTKACVTGWILPIIPVTALLIVQPYNYTKSLAGLCYPTQVALILTVLIPVGAILIINVIIYLLIIFDIFSVRKRCVKKELIFHWLIVVLLFFMLGVTWTFAFLGYIFKSSVLMSIFFITSSMQGFVVFLFFIVFNKNTRNMYVKWLKNYFGNNNVSSKISTIDKN